MTPWLGLDNIRFGIVGMAAQPCCTVVVTLLTPAPSKEIQDMVDEVRIPSRRTILTADH